MPSSVQDHLSELEKQHPDLDPTTLGQMEELFALVCSPSRTELQHQAVKSLLSLTASPPLRPYFAIQDYAIIKVLSNLSLFDPLTAHDALSSLINLSAESGVVQTLNSDSFLTALVTSVCAPTNFLADLCCMLLNNLTKNTQVASNVLGLALPSTLSSDSDARKLGECQKEGDATMVKDKKRLLDKLLDVFVTGESKQYNPQASFHFLSGVFANISALYDGREFFLADLGRHDSRLSKVSVFTQHPNIIRRGGVVSTLKNCAFQVRRHVDLLADKGLNILPYLLLPLSGDEEYTEKEQYGMPDELLFVDPSNVREPDESIRCMLVETLCLLTTTRAGRTVLRERKVYPVLQKMHLNESSRAVQAVVEQVVDMLMRDEATEDGSSAVTGIEPVMDSSDEDDMPEISNLI